MSSTNIQYIELQKSKQKVDDRLKEIGILNTENILSRGLRKERRDLRIRREVLNLKIVIEGAKQGLFRIER